MNLFCLRYEPYVRPGIIDTWTGVHNFNINSAFLFDKLILPDPDSVDGLVLSGGPIELWNRDIYSQLGEVTRFIRQCISHNKKVLGMGIGAQLMAAALGSNIREDNTKEIGWYLISWNHNARSNRLFSCLPYRQIVFNWRISTFDLPEGARRLASSRNCKNQAFLYGDNAVGLQFHPGIEQKHIRWLIDKNSEMLKERGSHIQSAEHMLDRAEYVRNSNLTLVRFLDRFFLGVFDAAHSRSRVGSYC